MNWTRKMIRTKTKIIETRKIMEPRRDHVVVEIIFIKGRKRWEIDLWRCRLMKSSQPSNSSRVSEGSMLIVCNPFSTALKFTPGRTRPSREESPTIYLRSFIVNWFSVKEGVTPPSSKCRKHERFPRWWGISPSNTAFARFKYLKFFNNPRNVGTWIPEKLFDWEP